MANAFQDDAFQDDAFQEPGGGGGLAVEVLVAADPFSNGFDLIPDTLFPPDFGQYNQPQEQAEAPFATHYSLTNNAEGGSDEVAVTTLNSGGASGTAWDTVHLGAAEDTIVFSNDQVIDTLAYRCKVHSQVTSGDYTEWVYGGANPRLQNQMWMRGYFWFSALPATTDDIKFWRWITEGGGTPGMTLRENGDVAQVSTGIHAGVANIPTERWVRIEQRIVCDQDNGTNGVLEMRVWYTDPNSGGAPDASQVLTGIRTGQDNVANMQVGFPSNNSAGEHEQHTVYFDNIAVSTLDWIGPLGTAPTTLERPSNPATYPHDVVPPWELEFDFNEPQDQIEWTAPTPAADEHFAAQPQGLDFDPQPDPDFFLWNQPQEQAEFLFEGENIDNLMAAQSRLEVDWLLPEPDPFDWIQPQDQAEWTAPTTPPETIENLIAAQPAMELDPQPDPDFFIWDHSQNQSEWWSPFISPSEVVQASQLDGLELNPLPDPDFFIWEHEIGLHQSETLIPPPAPVEPIETLIAADMFSTGSYDSRPMEPALVFDGYDQNTDPPAGTIQPPFDVGNIRRVPRWAKQRNFYPGGR